MPINQSALVEVKRVRGKGRGVFARIRIAKGTVIETVPVIVLHDREIVEHPSGSKLASYVYSWGKGTVAIALGYGSMYNHSYDANARYDDQGRMTKVFTATRDIEQGEEITVNYNGSPHDKTPMWFEAMD